MTTVADHLIAALKLSGLHRVYGIPGDSLNAFKYAGGAWDSKSINACVNESDAVGVYLHATHKFATGMFGVTFPVADRTVMRFEPLSEETCKPGRPAAHA